MKKDVLNQLNTKPTLISWRSDRVKKWHNTYRRITQYYLYRFATVYLSKPNLLIRFSSLLRLQIVHPTLRTTLTTYQSKSNPRCFSAELCSVCDIVSVISTCPHQKLVRVWEIEIPPIMDLWLVPRTGRGYIQIFNIWNLCSHVVNLKSVFAYFIEQICGLGCQKGNKFQPKGFFRTLLQVVKRMSIVDNFDPGNLILSQWKIDDRIYTTEPSVDYLIDPIFQRK